MSAATIKTAVTAATITIVAFIVISQCLVLRKAGKHWWYGLIPVLAEVELFDIAWKKRYAVFYIFGEAFLQFLVQLCQFAAENPSVIYRLFNSTVLTVFLVIISVFYVVDIQMSVKLANRFGRSEMFGIGCAILPFLFYPILAFGPAEDQWKKENSSHA